MASFSVSFDAFVIVLKFSEIGMVLEDILFGILNVKQSLFILCLGQDNQFME